MGDNGEDRVLAAIKPTIAEWRVGEWDQ